MTAKSPPEAIERLATLADVEKQSTRGLAGAIALGRSAATTVAATMFIAERAGIRVFATGGIGGVHRGDSADISAFVQHFLAQSPLADFNHDSFIDNGDLAAFINLYLACVN